MNLNNVLAAHAAYRTELKKHRNIKKDIAQYLADVLPEGIVIEWAQGTSMFETDFEASSPILSSIDQKEPIDGGYFLEQGLKGYTHKVMVPGLSKAQLRGVIATWNKLPADILQLAFGTATVRIQSNGKLTILEDE